MGRAKGKLSYLPISRQVNLNTMVDIVNEPDFKKDYQKHGASELIDKLYGGEYLKDNLELLEIVQIIDRIYPSDAETAVDIIARLPGQQYLSDFSQDFRHLVSAKALNECDVFLNTANNISIINSAEDDKFKVSDVPFANLFTNNPRYSDLEVTARFTMSIPSRQLRATCKNRFAVLLGTSQEMGSSHSKAWLETVEVVGEICKKSNTQLLKISKSTFEACLHRNFR